MDIPLELSFHNMDSSDGLQAAVSAHVARLEQLHERLVGCRVVIEMPHKRHRVGQNIPDVRILLRVPGKEIAITREMAQGTDKKNATDAYAALDNAFAVAASRLKDYRRQVQGEVKAKPTAQHGHIRELMAERDYGFISGPDGGEIYFHRNAVAGNGFESLRIGDAVEYAVTIGDKGEAAGRVWRMQAMNERDRLSSENQSRTD